MTSLMAHQPQPRSRQRPKPRQHHSLPILPSTKPKSKKPTPPPHLPPEVINLIISHYIPSYTLRITHAWWDFNSTIRIHGILPTGPLALVSRTFNGLVKGRLKGAFTGCARVDWDAAGDMQYYEVDRGGGRGDIGCSSPVSRLSDASASGSSMPSHSPVSNSSTETSSEPTHLSWMFSNIHTVQIVGYPATRIKPYTVDMRHWPALSRVEISLRVSLLPYMRTITEAEHDEEVLRIAGKVAETLKVEGVKDGEKVKIGYVFEGCRCGRDCVVRKGVGGDLVVLKDRDEW